jgi:hypothetical protein
MPASTNPLRRGSAASPGAGRRTLAALPLANAAGADDQERAYSLAERDSNSIATNADSPMTHASWPGSIT